jgi:serine/threonine-protein kinase
MDNADDLPTGTSPPALPSGAEPVTTDHAASGADPNATTAADAVPPRPLEFPARAGRCRVEGEIGRGGMGVVLRAVDPFFGRRLAVKVLKARADERPDLARRFLEEARLTGRLQHPGVPPVHDQGTLDDGRPYFTMKLIEGRTLADLLTERSSPLDDLPRFVAIFGQVCQTVAYAHSQGVVHRDLKPANVMVGGFGEVQVMDWGLAKVLRPVPPHPPGPPPPLWERGEEDQGESACPRIVHDPSPLVGEGGRGGERDRTQAGAALGTPAFMAPEQARGERDALDERCDVFGLGAILCAILTGAPPYRGATLLEALRQAQQGDLADAWQRLEVCGADAELTALARACLSPEPSQRPRDAGAAAAATARYQEGVQERLRKAERERAAAQAQAVEQRKRRRVQRALAAVVLGALLVGGAAWLWLSQQRATARAELAAALERSRGSMAAGDLAEAMAAARRAEGLLAAAGGDAGLRQEVDDRIHEIEFVGALERIRTPDNTAQERIASRARADDRYARAFRDLGVDVDALDPEEAARRIEARPALKPYLVAALDDWTGPRRQARPDDPAAVRRLLDLARRVDPDPWRDRLREAAGREDRDALAELARGADARAQTTSALLALAEQLMHGGQRKEATALLRKARWERPEDFWLSYYQGLWQGQDSDPGQIEEGTRCYAVAVALRPRNVEAWSGYCTMLEKQGRIDEAVTASRRAVELEPDSPSAQMALTGALTMNGDLKGAGQARGRVIELLRAQVRKDPGDDEAWVLLGINLERHGEREAAVQANREAARLAPHNAWARHNVGALLRKQGKAAEAIPWLEEAARLAADSAYILGTLGLARADVGDDRGAEEALRKAVAIQPYYLPPYGTLADVLQRRGDAAGSRDLLRQGLQRCAAVLEKYPNTFRAEFLSGYYLWKTGDLPASVKHTRRALEVNPSDADAYANLSIALHDLGLLDEAADASRQGARKAEPSALVFNDLAFDLMEKGDSLDEASQAIQRALALDPNSDLATLTQAEVLRAQGKFAESLEAYRRGHLLHSKKAVKKWPTADWVKDAERLVELERDLPAVLSGERKLAAAAENLEYGRLCGCKQRFTAAARFYDAAFALDPAAADNLGAGHRSLAAQDAALAALGRGADAPSSEAERARWRQRALDWLGADLALWRKAAEGKNGGPRRAARTALNRWRTHDALRGVRDAEALEALPEAEGRPWRRFWADVAALLDRLEDSQR